MKKFIVTLALAGVIAVPVASHAQTPSQDQIRQLQQQVALLVTLLNKLMAAQNGNVQATTTTTVTVKSQPTAPEDEEQTTIEIKTEEAKPVVIEKAPEQIRREEAQAYHDRTGQWPKGWSGGVQP